MATYKRTKTAPTSGSNLPPDPVAAYKAQVESKLADIQLDTAAIEAALSGANGFDVVTTRNVAVRPSLEMLTRWDQEGDIDPTLNTIVVQTHDASGAEYRPAILAEYRRAKFLAVCAAPADVVDRCRFKVDASGNVLKGVRARGNVPAQVYGSDDTAKALLNVSDAAQANAMLVTERDKAVKALAALGPKPSDAAPLSQRNAWRDADRIATMWKRAEPTIEGICWIADMENSAKQGVSLFRRRLLVDFGKDRFDQYKQNETTKPIYNILDVSLGKMMSAQKSWYRDQFKGVSDEADEAKRNAKRNAILADLPLKGEEMRTAMRKALDEYLAPFETGKVKEASKSVEEMLSEKLWRAARACEKHFAIKGEVISEGLMRITAKWREEGLKKPKMSEDEEARIDALSTLDVRADTRAAAADVTKASDGDAAKRQAELDAQAAKEAADKANAPTPTPAPVPVSGPAAASKLGRRGRGKARLPT